MLKFITGNKTKFLEIQKQLWPIKLEQMDIDLEEIQGVEPREIIKHKLKQALKHHKGEFIVDDSSLTFDALGGKLPGPFIKWFNTHMGYARMVELVKKLGNNRATATTIIGYAKNSKHFEFFEGKLKGRIVPVKGKYLFGYDPIFKPDGLKLTLSELKATGNFSVSPRGLAVKKLARYLKNR